MDVGVIEIVFDGAAPELHGLGDAIDGLCSSPITHEELTARIKDLLGDASVGTAWRTGPWAVEVVVA